MNRINCLLFASFLLMHSQKISAQDWCQDFSDDTNIFWTDIVNHPSYGILTSGDTVTVDWNGNTLAPPYNDFGNGFAGIYYGPLIVVDFGFNNNSNFKSFDLYLFANQSDQTKISINGSNFVDLNQNFPINLAGVSLNFVWTNYQANNFSTGRLTVTGSAPNISFELFEAGISNMCLSESNLNIGEFTEISSNEILLFPNPALNEMKINCNVEILEVTLLTLDGRLINHYNKSVNNCYTIEHLDPGYYLFRVKTSYGEVIKSFLKVG